MDIAFQNKREDFEAFYNYIVRDTEQGKTLGKRALRAWLIETALTSIVIGSFYAIIFSTWQAGLVMAILLFLFGLLLRLFISGFKPIYHAGIQVYKNQEKSITPRELDFFQLPRTISIDDNWLKIRSSEAEHRWRWRRVDKIGITSNYVFIHVGNCPVVYVPKRDFPSEQSFMEFGKKLVELKEKNKDQPMGAE